MQNLDWQKGLLILFILLLGGVCTLYLFSLQQPKTAVYVPNKDLPVYHLISASDLMTSTLPSSEIPSKSILKDSDLTNRYSSQSLSAKKPVTATQLVPVVDEQYVANTTAVPIPATATMAYNGKLAPGAIVTVWNATPEGKVEALLDDVLVLDVLKIEGQSDGQEKDFPYVIVLAVPQSKQTALLTAVSAGSLSIALGS